LMFRMKLCYNIVISLLYISTLAFGFEFYDANWTLLQPTGDVPKARHQHTAVMTKNGIMIVFGGIFDYSDGCFNDVHHYDTALNRWTLQKPTGTLPKPRRRQSAVLTDEDSMIIFGGLGSAGDNLNDVAKYNYANGDSSWELIHTSGSRPAGRQGHIAVYTPRRTMIIFGGRGPTQFFNDVWELDLKTHEWIHVQPNGPTPVPRFLMSSVTLGTEMLIFGGTKGHGGYNFYLNEVLRYNLANNTWLSPIETSHTPSARAQHAATIIDGQMVAVGGYDLLYLHDVILLDPGKPVWNRVIEDGSFPIGIEAHTIVAKGNTIYVFGGEDSFSMDTLYQITVTKSPLPVIV